MKPISISLSPNVEKDDASLAFKLLFQPWRWNAGDSIKKLEDEFKKYFGVKYAFSFNSGRSALMALLESLKLEKNDEVLLQAFTCNAASNPVIWSGLKPVYVDCDEKTFNIDTADLERKINLKSKAVMVQHTFGLPSDMDEVLKICRENNLILIEDCAHALGASYKGKKIGTFGKAAFFSFSRDKIISSVYGGIALTDDKKLSEKLEKFQKKSGFPCCCWVLQQLLHPVLMNWLILPTYKIFGKYLLVLFQWLHILSKAVHWKEKRGKKPSYFPKRMPNALAELALNQFGKLDKFNNHRRKIADFYYKELKDAGFELPLNFSDIKQTYLRFAIKNKKAHEIIKSCWKNNILIGDWYTTPIAPHDTKPKKVGYVPGSCLKAEKLSEIVLNLPTHINISEREAKTVSDFIKLYEDKEIQDKRIWENFLLPFDDKTFLQSWNWGDFNMAMGNKVWRFGVYEEDELVGTALVSKVVAKRGTFLLVQHGPNVKDRSKNFKALIALLSELKKLGKDEGIAFIRLNPLWENSKENQNVFKKLGFKQAQMHASAYDATWKLNIDKPEQELLSGMRKTTRYLIRSAQNNPDIEVLRSNNPEDVQLYDKLNKEVARFQRFVPFSFDFAKKEFDAFLKDNEALLFFSKYKGEIVASALVVFWSGIAFYHQAALSPKYHKIPVAYLLQWEAIKEAKKRGCRLYDFWGFVDPKENPNHPWAGPTLFKMGFSGQRYQYLKTQDFPLSWRYWLVFLFEKLRKIKRSL
ncbi:MAG: peptidoglycan bridge formation glycyltransferase FemA/FemB family protein [Candidatus Nealsonbacteria bacterium]|nr:peptidoglycan bridge formation glycyltransferase FemA/FemB family protein [Candidatus Nealsonbacteria bacterium]